MKQKCKNGKVILDKKSAIAMANLTFRLHHIKMDIYHCDACNFWHLATSDHPKFRVTRHKRFRHNL